MDWDATIARTNEEDFQFLLKIDKRFAHVDIDFVREKNDDGLVIEGKRVELDAVLARASEEEYGGSPEALWDYIMDLLKVAYPLQNYNRVIDSKSSTLYNYYPKPFRQLATLLEEHVDEILEDKMFEIENKLEETDGFIDVKKEREEIDKSEGKIIEDDQLMKKIGKVLEQVDQQYNFGIVKTEPQPISLSSEFTKTERGVKKIEAKEESNHQADSSEIPDPPITEEVRQMSKGLYSNGFTTMDWARFTAIREYGSKEINDKIWNNKIRCNCRCEIIDVYKQVIKDYKEQHNQRLPWEED